MHKAIIRRSLFSQLLLIAVILLAPFATAQESRCEPGQIVYAVSLRDRAAHIAHITIASETHGERDFQLPVWNALYQVRDFAQFVNNVHAQVVPHVRPTSATAGTKSLSLHKLDKTTWRVSAANGCVVLTYDAYADERGPFGTQINSDHAFLNWAMVLMYPVDGRSTPVRIRLEDLAPDWRVASERVFSTTEAGGIAVEGSATNYDMLVDSPAELSKFSEADFTEGGAKYRIIVDGNPSDYDMSALTAGLRKIVAAEVDWMQDRPFAEYMFIYHLPRGPAGGGMEHAYSTAIDVSAPRFADNPLSLWGVSAHEFFHLWNVKRIRPKALDPVDFTREQYTRALWFSEGVTSAVQEHMLFRAGLLDERQYLERLATQIESQQSRPAHAKQSAEESSLDAWLEKYAYYNLPERSVSYYTKGQLLGELLDLRLREVSDGTKSLRDLFRLMNANAKRGEFFDDSAGVRNAAGAITGADFTDFFSRYVAGVEELPYDDALRGIGLRLVRSTTQVASIGFQVGRRRGGIPVVVSVESDSEAARQGIAPGDAVMQLNAKPAGADFEMQIAAMRPGDTARLTIRSARGERDIKVKLTTREREHYSIEDLPQITSAQRARRAAWLRGDSQPATAAAGDAQR